MLIFTPLKNVVFFKLGYYYLMVNCTVPIANKLATLIRDEKVFSRGSSFPSFTLLTMHNDYGRNSESK